MSDDTKKSIQISIPNRSASSEMSASLAKTLQSLEVPESLQDYKVSVNFHHLQPVDANRNEMVKSFLEKEHAEWLLMIDSDIVPPVDILKMVEHDKPIVSAVCTIKKGDVPQPVIVKEAGNNYRQVNIQEAVDEIDDETGLLEVEGVGTGAILIRRDVLEDMKPPWFKFEYNEYGGLKLGEDFYFSRRCKQNDVDMFVDTTMITQHFKKTDLTEYAQNVAEIKQNMIDKEKEEALEDEG